MKRTWKRRNYFINKDLQGRYLFISFVFAVTELVLFAVIIGLSQAEKFTVSYEHSSLKVGKAPLVLLEQILGAHWVFIIGGGLVIALGSLFLTHRFAGPLYRFEQMLTNMLQGRFDNAVTLRTRDEGKALGNLINQLNVKLSTEFGELQRTARAVEASLEQAGEEGDPAAAREAIRQAKKEIRILAEQLDGYELQSG